MPAEVHIQINHHQPEPPPLLPVEVSVQGVYVCFNGVPTLILVEPLPASALRGDPLVAQVANMYAHGYVHRAR